MQCVNHPEVGAVARCVGCSEPFCFNCLVAIRGQKYCASCKVMAIQGRPVMDEATIACPEADEALKYALIGILCFGIILEPMAISRALKAKKKIEQDPRLMGSGKANAAFIIGIIALVLWVLGLLSRFQSL